PSTRTARCSTSSGVRSRSAPRSDSAGALRGGSEPHRSIPSAPTAARRSTVAPEPPADGGPGQPPVSVRLLGRFEVAVGDVTIADGAWRARRAAELVQLLSLADGRRLLSDQVIDALWPHLAPEAGAANLRKA